MKKQNILLTPQTVDAAQQTGWEKRVGDYIRWHQWDCLTTPNETALDADDSLTTFEIRQGCH